MARKNVRVVFPCYSAVEKRRAPGGRAQAISYLVVIRSPAAATFASVVLLIANVSLADVPDMSGGGNIGKYQSADMQDACITTLRATGASRTRLNIYPNDYYDTRSATAKPTAVDAVMDRLYRGHVTPMILFEFRNDYVSPPRDYQTWHNIGRSFADRWRPNSDYLRSQKISHWGVSVYSAINEPDGGKEPRMDTNDYHNMLEGLADGVHSVDASLKVIPGGFCSENSANSHTLRGFGTAIAPLLNSGKLDGIDLHTYNDVLYAPIVKSNGTTTFIHSPQSDFDSVKAACGITRDIGFYTTEYGFKANTQDIDDNLAAKRLLTCIWANAGVVKTDGRTPATKFALTWNLYNTISKDSTYGMCTQLAPWEPTPKGKTFQMVMRLTRGLEFEYLDPKGTGEFILAGKGKKMWVWQNYPHWSSISGTSYIIKGIPTRAVRLEIYDWDSWTKPKRTLALSGRSSCLVSGLNAQETYMFLVSFPLGR